MKIAGETQIREGMRANDSYPMISVVIPMKNEEEHITRCLQSVIDGDYPNELIEVLVVDGGSNDRSLKIVDNFAAKCPNVRLLGGPGINCPAAMNIGIREARGNVISKIDAHGYVAQDFLRNSAKYLLEDGDIKCVGGPIRPLATTSMAQANALARSSIFGVARGTYSIAEKSQFVDTVQCGTYKRDVFGSIGLFDESLQFGEDEEINWRIRKKGYKIFSTPEICFFYFPRDSFHGLFRQYYNYGDARVRVIRKHRSFFRMKHIIPTMFLMALFITGILATFSQVFSVMFTATAAAYLTTSLTFSVLIGARHGFRHLVLLPISFGALHFGYGLGCLTGIMRLCAQKLLSK
jgi:glycosyltransferase involved in cell wall biosynthesis